VRVFVSHCANHDDRSKTVVEHLVSELSDDDVKLVWDRELLQVGDEWDDKLLKEIEECDGAILLLAATALKRPYVVKECTLLAQRKRHSEKWGGNTFEMLSVFIGDVAPETLDDPAKSHMTDLNLAKYQAGKDDDMQVLVDSLRQRLDRLKIACRGDRPRQELLKGISRQIQTGTPGSDEYLTTSINALERGFELQNDYYNGINLAFMLNVRAAQTETARDEARADYSRAKSVRRQVCA
jgi:hypothetical protein